jgi:hypothetical protein
VRITDGRSARWLSVAPLRGNGERSPGSAVKKFGAFHEGESELTLLRKLTAGTAVAGAVAALAIAFTASPAHADPCGASSSRVNERQVVAYRNCGSGTVYRQAAIENYGSGGCTRIYAGTSQYLHWGGSSNGNWRVWTC